MRNAWLLGLLAGCTSRVDTGPPGPDDTGPPPDDTAGAADDTGTGGPDDTADTGGDTGRPASDGLLALCINEFMPANEASLSLGDGTWPDWIELHNPGVADVGLAGWGITDDRTEPTAEVLTGDLVIPAGGFLLLYADHQAGPDHLRFRLDADGGEVALFDPEGDGQIITYGNVEDDFSVSRRTDCCTGEGCLGFDFHGTPGITNVHIVWTEVTLLPGGSTWRYWDHPSSPGDAWASPTFDDTWWDAGPGPLGFGDSHLATFLDGGPEGKRRPTTWFRNRVDVPSLDAVRSAFVEAMIDDGAVLWVNGVEALRINMPDGEVTTSTWASTGVSGVAEYTFAHYEFDASLLVEGENTLAVEVHQASASSTDLTFDLAFGVERPE